jgi:hypothetical protein
MTSIPLTEEQVTEDLVVLNLEEVGLSDDQFSSFVATIANFTVYLYRPGKPVECLANPATLEGDPVLPGFVFQIGEVWQE